MIEWQSFSKQLVLLLTYFGVNQKLFFSVDLIFARLQIKNKKNCLIKLNIKQFLQSYMHLKTEMLWVLRTFELIDKPHKHLLQRKKLKIVWIWKQESNQELPYLFLIFLFYGEISFRMLKKTFCGNKFPRVEKIVSS